MNDDKYALKNAFLYTVFVAAILLAPLLIYTIYMKNVYEVQNELDLKKHARMVVRKMEEFGSRNEPTFNFPRFQLMQAGIYNGQFKPIFTLIKEPIENFSPGYHKQRNYAYYIMTLPEQKYFSASYLIVGNKLSYVGIYQKSVMALLSVVVLVFLISIFFLKRFALPFKRVNQKLDSFIKDSMHEINTPLSIINVNIDLFNRKNPENKYLRRIKAATKTLSNIYNDMDYLIKEEEQGFKADKINFDEYLKERVEYFSEVAAMKNISIVLEADCNIVIVMSVTKLQRIIDNNLSNAIKYSFENTKIEVNLKKTGDGGCVLSFKDEGVGIKNPERIFERYYREKSDKGGFGIGLNIVKQIADDVGIKLNITSELRKGSCFSYYIPAKLTTQAFQIKKTS